MAQVTEQTKQQATLRTAATLAASTTLVLFVGGKAPLEPATALAALTPIALSAFLYISGALAAIGRSPEMGLSATSAAVEPDALRARIEAIEHKLETGTRQLLDSQGVRLVRGRGRLAGPHCVVVDTEEGPVELDADAILLSTGSRPRLPDWAEVDGERVLSTRDAYPPAAWPVHLVVIGSGVTGVEFVHMFSSLGSQVTLIVSRQQVLPQKDPEVAAALEDELLSRGVRLLKGARAEGIAVSGSEVAVAIAWSHVETDDTTTKKIAIVARDAEVRASDLTWPAGITAAQKAAALAQLASRGIVAR